MSFGQYRHCLLSTPPACQQCPLAGSKVVFPDGPVPAPIAIVGEGPGCVLPGTYLADTEQAVSPVVFNIDSNNSSYGPLRTREHVGDFVTINALGHYVSLTPEHQVKVRATQTQKGHERRRLGQSHWTPAQNVTKEHFLVVDRRPVLKAVIAYIDTSGYEVGRAAYRGGIVDHIPCDDLTAIAFGLLLGDGSAPAVATGTVRWHLSDGYKEQFVSTVRCFIERLGASCTIKRSGKHIDIVAYSTKLSAFVNDNFYTCSPGSRTSGSCKKIPDFVWLAGPRFASMFLFGWYGADGKHLKALNKGAGISTVSRTALAQGVDLYIRLGVIPSIRTNRPIGKAKQTCYDMFIGNSLIKQLDWPLRTHNRGVRRLYQEDADGFYIPVSKTERGSYSGPVYDRSAPDGKLHVPFVIHNSEEVREGIGLVGPTGKLMWILAGSVGLKREMCWVSNSTLCAPKRVKLASGMVLSKERVKVLSVAACRQRLVDELKAVNPRVTIPLGNFALWALSDLPNANITNYRGAIMNLDLERLSWQVRTGNVNLTAPHGRKK